MKENTKKQNTIVNEILNRVPDQFHRLIQEALMYAKNAYKGQERFSGETVYDHAINVALNSAKLNMDTISIISAILHQVFYDKNSLSKHKEIISTKFGKEVVEMLIHLNQINIATKTKNIRSDETVRNYLIYGVSDYRISMIKLCDILENSETIKYLPPQKQKHLIEKIFTIYGPLADFLNMGIVKKIIEENAYKTQAPESFQHIEKLLKQNDMTQESLDNVIQYINNLLQFENIKAEVFGRVKSVYSLTQKQKKYFSELKSINALDMPDILAFTILLTNEDDCFKVNKIFKIFTDIDYTEYDDYITNPKPNGYKSIQFPTKLKDLNNLTVEIQIKTHEMHYHSTYGPSSHIAYKLALKRNVEATDEYNWLKEIHSKIVEHTNLRENRKSIPLPNKFQSENIFVFTPKGMIIQLEKGSTVLDFAQKVHTKFKKTITSAKINSLGATKDTILKNNDIVELVLDRNRLRSM